MESEYALPNAAGAPGKRERRGYLEGVKEPQCHECPWAWGPPMEMKVTNVVVPAQAGIHSFRHGPPLSRG